MEVNWFEASLCVVALPALQNVRLLSNDFLWMEFVFSTGQWTTDTFNRTFNNPWCIVLNTTTSLLDSTVDTVRFADLSAVHRVWKMVAFSFLDTRSSITWQQSICLQRKNGVKNKTTLNVEQTSIISWHARVHETAFVVQSTAVSLRAMDVSNALYKHCTFCPKHWALYVQCPIFGRPLLDTYCHLWVSPK